MGLSETIVAAMIGAIATVSTALFQIFTALKARNKVDVKPRRGSALRSVLAVLALMIASAAGGFLYSELLRQRGGEDIRAMRQELRELRDLTVATVRERGNREMPIGATAAVPAPTATSETTSSLEPMSRSAELGTASEPMSPAATDAAAPAMTQTSIAVDTAQAAPQAASFADSGTAE